MSTTSIIILSILQGLTEFLPVSSTGHLLIAKKWLGLTTQGMTFEIWVHLATLGSLLIFFRKDIIQLLPGKSSSQNKSNESQWLSLILISSVVTALIGIPVQKILAGALLNPTLIKCAFVVTGITLLCTRWAHPTRNEISWRDALWFGFAQGAAVVPGLSRSGLTISFLLFLGINRETAFRYSFLASIPILIGAFLIESQQGAFASFRAGALGLSFIITILVGLFSLYAMRGLIRRQKIYLFGFYCLIIAILGFWNPVF